MADCGAAGSAIDRAASALASATLSNGGGGGNAEAAAAAARAAASLAGSVGMTASSVGPRHPMGTMMPSAPPDRLVLPASGVAPPAAAAASAAQAGLKGPAAAAAGTMGARMDAAWGAAAASATTTAPPQHRGGMMAPHAPPPPHAAAMHHHHHHHAMMAQHQQAAAMQMQMQMQQMHMMQAQMQHMTAMQAQQRAQKQLQEALERQRQERILLEEDAKAKKSAAAENSDAEKKEAAAAAAARQKQTPADPLDEVATSWHADVESDVRDELRGYRRNVDVADDHYADAEEDDVATTAEEDAAEGHEGFAAPASIEELARAWEEAEIEYDREYEAERAANGSFDAANAAAVEGATNMAAAHLKTEEEMHPYEFSPEVENHEHRTPDSDVDLFSEGMTRFEAGDISLAIQSFESLLRHVDPDHPDAWRMLGKCHAENDEDRKAIACLERAVERDPYCPESLLALGVSYVNELDHGRAARCVRDWIAHNPNYAGMDLPASTTRRRLGEREALEDLKNLLRRAMEYAPSESSDALEALGVVCNVTRDYDDAVSSLTSALSARPDDYQLSNRLGATLANAGRSEEALPYYQKALSLKPKYARAWLNLAISHSNLRNYDEAARCYLQALSLSPGADHVWGYLRIALTCSERWDLLPFAASMDLGAFEGHFDFVRY